MGYPCVTADLPKLWENVNRCADLCHEQGIALAAVTKGFCADERIVGMLDGSRCDALADAQIKNLRSIRSDKPKLLIRVAQPWEADEVVRRSDMSLQSDAETIRLLGRAAARQGLRHRVLLSCDLGDLREGCFFENPEDILRTAEAVVNEPALELYGVGMNLGCFGGVLPCEENMTGLVRIVQALRERFGVEAPVVSGGSSTIIHHLLRREVPAGINQIRVGELWLTGHDPGLGCDIEGFHNDGIRLRAQLVEVKEKPSRPIGPIGGDAFGVVREWEDSGVMRRGLMACGKQELELDSLHPMDGRIRVIGGSSDYTILDLTDAPEYKAGDLVDFRLGYGSILRVFTGHYTERVYLS